MKREKRSDEQWQREVESLRQRNQELEALGWVREEKLRDHLRLLETLLDTIPNPVFYKDKQGIYLGCNRSFASQILGLPVEEIVGSSLFDLSPAIPRERAEIYYKQDQELLQNPGVQHYETKVLCADGVLRDFMFSKAIFADTKGESRGIIGVMLDITERKASEESLRQNQSLLQAILDGISTNIAFVNRDLEILWANKAAARSVRCSSSEVLGRRCYELWADPTEPCRGCPTVRALDSLQPEQSLMTTPDGRMWEEKGEPVFDSEGELLGVVEIAHDVTEMKQAEESLRHRVELEKLIASISRHFLSLPHEDIDEGVGWTLEQVGSFTEVARSYVFLCSPEGETLDNTHEWCAPGIEPQIEQLQGVPAEMIPWWMKKLYRLEHIHIPRVADLPAEAQSEKEILQAQSIQSLLVVPLNCGERLLGFLGLDSVRCEQEWMEEDIVLLRMVGEIVVSALKRKEAEEEKRRLQAQLQHQQKLESIGTLASGVAHEINNPINSVMNYAQLIVDRLQEDGHLLPFAQNIIEESERIAAIVCNLLSFSRSNNDPPSVLQLNELIQDTVSLIGSTLRKDKIQLKIELAEEMPPLRVQPQKIQQVLMNLLTNARDALNLRYSGGHPQKMIRIQTQRREVDDRQWLRITVEDQGVGISPKDHSRIFEPFFSTKPRGKGTGLGLAISYGIVQDHQGHLLVESGTGQPTRFHLELPL